MFSKYEDELMKITFKSLANIAAMASISALASFGANAQSNEVEVNDSGFYVGGNYGYLRVEGEDEFDDDKDVWQGLVGYKFNQWIALEGGYIDFGDYGNDVAGAETDGYTAAIKGILPLTERFSLYAKAGQLWSETEYRLASIRQDSDDESLFVGAGLSYAITGNFLVNAEYVVYDTQLDADEAFDDIDDTNFETDLKQASLGVEYRF
jgi:opacity protein-like surface antigen